MLYAEFLLPKIFCGRSTSSVRALGHSSTKFSTAVYTVKWQGLQTKFSAKVLVHFAFTDTMYLSPKIISGKRNAQDSMEGFTRNAIEKLWSCIQEIDVLVNVFPPIELTSGATCYISISLQIKEFARAGGLVLPDTRSTSLKARPQPPLQECFDKHF